MKWTSARAWTRWSPTASGTQLGFDPETTLHDVRYGEEYGERTGVRLGVRDFRRRAAASISSAATRAR